MDASTPSGLSSLTNGMQEKRHPRQFLVSQSVPTLTVALYLDCDVSVGEVQRYFDSIAVSCKVDKVARVVPSETAEFWIETKAISPAEVEWHIRCAGRFYGCDQQGIPQRLLLSFKMKNQSEYESKEVLHLLKETVCRSNSNMRIQQFTESSSDDFESSAAWRATLPEVGIILEAGSRGDEIELTIDYGSEAMRLLDVTNPMQISGVGLKDIFFANFLRPTRNRRFDEVGAAAKKNCQHLARFEGLVKPEIRRVFGLFDQEWIYQ